MDRSRALARARRAALIWAVFLLTLTSWPKPPTVPIVSAIPNFDKVIHFVLYGVEAFLLYQAVLWPGRPRFSLGRVLALVGAMAVWAMADETHQAWIPGRSMEAGDVAADVTGAVVGAMVASITDRGRAAARAALRTPTGTEGIDS
ncbi:MAG TPA: VanZ family protein [Thermoanaerobaculia bacterium]|nr:VanZ family protein [Thermoanaerobaculia bacterium]